MIPATTCHPPDECAICNIYMDHFDITSLLMRLNSTDLYTQGLQQGIALRTHETDTQVSRFRSQLAACHLRSQDLQSESNARNFQIQSLEIQATRSAMEIELLKRELAMERDRTVALETACDELQVELADERLKTVDAQAVTVAAEDWIWDWDDDWEKHEREASKSDSEEHQPSALTINANSNDTPSALTPQSPLEEDWGWVYNVPVDHVEDGFYWEDYQENLSPVDSEWSSTSLEKDIPKVQPAPGSDWERRDFATQPIPEKHGHPFLCSQSSERPESALGLLPEPTLKEIIELIGIASLTTSMGSTEKLVSLTTTPEAALNRIRSLIQQAERTPRHRRSEVQIWLLTNWRRPSSIRPKPGISLKSPSHATLHLPVIPEIFVDASESGVGVYFPLPPHPSSGSNPWQWLAYRWSEKPHPSMFIGPKGKVVIVWAELIAVEMGLHVLRAFGYGHEDETAGQSVRVVGNDVFLDSQDAQVDNGENRRLVNERPIQNTPILIRSDNLGVVRALSWLSSPNPTESSAPSTKMWPEIKGLNVIANRILRTSALYNMDLRIRWVRSKENLADGPSRASWDGTWNSRLGKGGFPNNGKQPEKFREEMVDWNVLHTRTGMERVPNHLSDCLKPLSRGL